MPTYFPPITTQKQSTPLFGNKTNSPSRLVADVPSGFKVGQEMEKHLDSFVFYQWVMGSAIARIN
ncbi:hypothetical protein PN499_19645 [Kamptonema animale CS-326]|uniref:hypothetical protein n=1 Tax=Kamptonema animale TaxID=92934 RepID=UPI00232AA005|nr:hypothetical protein [Kamptonema animale]MDB9513412.1 hypothetical protein [Kamptonema animale CS-326]